MRLNLCTRSPIKSIVHLGGRCESETRFVPWHGRIGYRVELFQRLWLGLHLRSLRALNESQFNNISSQTLPWDRWCVKQSTVLINNRISPVAQPTQLKSYKSRPLSGRFVPLQWEEEVQPQKKAQCRSAGTKNMFCHSRTSLIATKTLAVGLKLLPEYKFRSAKNEHVDCTNLNIIPSVPPAWYTLSAYHLPPGHQGERK